MLGLLFFEVHIFHSHSFPLCMCASRHVPATSWVADFSPICPNTSDKHFFQWQYHAAHFSFFFWPLNWISKVACAAVHSARPSCWDSSNVYQFLELVYCPTLPLPTTEPAQLDVKEQ